MFVILYRWRIKPNFEQQFIESWSERTAFGGINTVRSARVCIGETTELDIATHEWKSAGQREQAFVAEAGGISDTHRKFQEVIEEDFPEIKLEIISDYLLLPEDY